MTVTRPTTDDRDDDLERLKELAEKATPGLWQSGGRFEEDEHFFEEVLGGGVPGSAQERQIAVLQEFPNRNAEADAEFIAAASPDVTRALIGEVVALRGERDQLRAGEAEDRGDDNAMPTPAQWIKRWNDATPDQRLLFAEQIIDNGESSHRCFISDHEGHIEYLTAALAERDTRLQAVEAECAKAEHGALRWADPLPVPEWVARVRAAARGGDKG